MAYVCWFQQDTAADSCHKAAHLQSPLWLKPRKGNEVAWNRGVLLCAAILHLICLKFCLCLSINQVSSAVRLNLGRKFALALLPLRYNPTVIPTENTEAGWLPSLKYPHFQWQRSTGSVLQGQKFLPVYLIAALMQLSHRIYTDTWPIKHSPGMFNRPQETFPDTGFNSLYEPLNRSDGPCCCSGPCQPALPQTMSKNSFGVSIG